MTPTVLLPVLIGGLFAAGVYLLLDRSLTRVLLGVLLLGNGVNLLLLSAGGGRGVAPIVGHGRPDGDERPAAAGADPHRDRDHLRRVGVPAGDGLPRLAATVHEEVVRHDEEDRRVAVRRATDAEDLDPGELADDVARPPTGRGERRVIWRTSRRCR